MTETYASTKDTRKPPKTYLETSLEMNRDMNRMGRRHLGWAGKIGSSPKKKKKKEREKEKKETKKE